MVEILHFKPQDIPPKHIIGREGCEYYRRELVTKKNAEQCNISIYEIPPGKSAYPYHYHLKNEESFYIISGNGILKAPSGNIAVTAGDFLFFPANEKGTHKLTNTSENEMLTYLDFDTYNDIDLTLYPDSGKIGIWGKDVDKLFKMCQEVNYYDGE